MLLYLPGRVALHWVHGWPQRRGIFKKWDQNLNMAADEHKRNRACSRVCYRSWHAALAEALCAVGQAVQQEKQHCFSKCGCLEKALKSLLHGGE